MTNLTAVQAYIQSLQDHIKYVQRAGEKLGVPWEVLSIHDQSKFSLQEFMPYALKFFNKDGTPRETAKITQNSKMPATDTLIEHNFIRAWLHHMHKNNHHWQHWIFPDGYHQPMLVDDGIMTENGVMYMPQICTLEMIADWMGSSKTYTGSWEMGPWLIGNMKRITLHPKTAEYVRITLIDNGYRKIVDNYEFKHEIED